MKQFLWGVLIILSVTVILAYAGTLTYTTTEIQALLDDVNTVSNYDGVVAFSSGSGVEVDTAAELEQHAGLGAFFNEYADDANAAAMRTTIGLAIGTDVLAPDGDGSSLTNVEAATGDNATDFFGAGEIADARISNTHSHAADAIDAITEIAAALKSGDDGTLVTGTSGTNGNCAEWDANGDLIDSGGACGAGSGDVISSANITDNAIVRGDGGVKGVQDSGVLIDDSDNISGVASIDVDASATPNMTFEDSDAPGEANINVDSSGDSVLKLNVDDSAGDDSNYVEINGTDEMVYVKRALSAGPLIVWHDVAGGATVNLQSSYTNVCNVHFFIYDTDNDGAGAVEFDLWSDASCGGQDGGTDLTTSGRIFRVSNVDGDTATNCGGGTDTCAWIDITIDPPDAGNPGAKLFISGHTRGDDGDATTCTNSEWGDGIQLIGSRYSSTTGYYVSGWMNGTWSAP
jgi:hypothetical protein